MKNFYTIFPKLENVHLIKDVGMIPFFFNKRHGFKSFIITYNNGLYPYLENEVNGVELIFIKKITGIATLDVCFFLLNNFRKIDVLNCFHFMRSSLLFIFLFRILTFFNKSKKVYLKLDAAVDFNKLMPKNFFERFTLNSIDIISVENVDFYNRLKSNNFYNKTEVLYIPNGIDNRTSEIINFDKKSNIILTVGRIGSKEKANEVLLSAFVEFEKVNKDWKLCLVGPIEKDFESYIKEFFTKYDYLKDKVSFVGAVYDRETLVNYYKEAKIFVLSSDYEGFPLVFLEALKYGCTIVSTNFPSAKDVVINQKMNSLYNTRDFLELSRLLSIHTSNEEELEKNCYQNQKLVTDQFDWENLIDKIYEGLFK